MDVVAPQEGELALPAVFVIPEPAPLRRFDASLGLLFPGLGLRGRRRLWTRCRMLVNGVAREPGYMVKGGDELRVIPASGPARDTEIAPPVMPSRPDLAASPGSGPGTNKAPAGLESPTGMPLLAAGIALIAANRDFVALAKPAGLHSAHIAASAEPSLEALLRSTWPGLQAAWAGTCAGSQPQSQPENQEAPEPPVLLTRLDKATSGLILACRTPEAGRRFRALEQRALVRKTYLAVLRGRLEDGFVATGRLRVDNRRMTRVLPEADPDPARHTRVEPLALDPDLATQAEQAGITLVRVFIHRGARHQIRAHLADAGFPLLGEWQYAPAPQGNLPLFLHHAALEFPGFSARMPAPWDMIGILARLSLLDEPAPGR